MPLLFTRMLLGNMNLGNRARRRRPRVFTLARQPNPSSAPTREPQVDRDSRAVRGERPCYLVRTLVESTYLGTQSQAAHATPLAVVTPLRND